MQFINVDKHDLKKLIVKINKYVINKLVNNYYVQEMICI